MEQLLDEFDVKKVNKYKLLKADYFTQVTLFWVIVALSITVYGLLISLPLMMVWGFVQIISAVYNSWVNKPESKIIRLYFAYWYTVLLAIITFTMLSLSKGDQVTYLFIISMATSFVAGCIHTYIIKIIYKS